MEKALRIADLFKHERDHLGKIARVQGWVRTKRDSKAGICFIELNDGSCLRNLQIVAELDHPTYRGILANVSTGSSLQVEGEVKASPGKGQAVEINATSMTLIGGVDPATYPLQKKRHSFEFLRQIAHLRPRTNTIGSMTRPLPPQDSVSTNFTTSACQ